MGGSHLYLRAVAVALAAGLLGPSCSCSDRVVGEAPEGDGVPACLWLISPEGFRADGSTSIILDHARDRSGTVCLCQSQGE